MNRRDFTKALSLLTVATAAPIMKAHAKTYLSIEQARKLLWGEMEMTPIELTLSESQRDAIKEASSIRVRNDKPKVWKTADGGWFIVDQVIGKHENIDIAFAYTREGKVKGLEILTYRETYGYEVANPKWRAQLHGKDFTEHLKLDKQVKNISGATLSCRHITDGINRLNHTWNLVLRKL